MKARKTVSNIVNESNYVQLNGFFLKNFFLKLESMNPAGSIKMKTAIGLIDDKEKQGVINKNSVIIESSSGNLGIALSMVAAERGYRFVCVADINTSKHSIKLMEALGTSVVVIDKVDENGGFLGSRIAYIKKILEQDKRYIWLNQYSNSENPETHARTTAPSIAGAFEKIDFIFVGAGTTGTLMGIVKFFKEHSPKTKIIAIDSVGSITFGNKPSKRYIPGLGTSRRPEIYNPNGIHAFEMIDEHETIAMCRYLARSNGLLVGGSTGTVLCGVKRWINCIPPSATVVAISPDMGERYLDTIYNDQWVTERFGEQPLKPLRINNNLITDQNLHHY